MRARISPLNLLVHAAAWIPLIVLIADYQSGGLTVNPIQAAQRRTGNIALVLLILSLACTPANLLFKRPGLLRLSRPLGLYAYLYAALHLFIFTGLDYGFDFSLLWQELREKRYVLAGLAAFLLLTPLAVTSYRWWQRRLGKNWKRLHRLVYAANLLVVLHFAWVVKGDLLRLQGEILRPLLAGVVVAALLALRLPPVRRALSRRRLGSRQRGADPRQQQAARPETGERESMAPGE
jgi:methionine sulfoxide reductase heme-binding subunit